MINEKWFAETLYKRSVPIAAAVLLVVFGLIAGLYRLQTDFSVRVWFREKDPYIEFFDQFQREFGNDDSVAVGLYVDSGVFHQSFLKSLHQLTLDLEKVSDVVRVDSLTNFQNVYGQGDEIIVEPLVPEQLIEGPSFSSDKVLQIKERALNHRVLPNYLVSPDAKTTALFLRLRPVFEGRLNYKKIAAEVDEVLLRHKDLLKGADVYVAGSGAIPPAFQKITMGDVWLLTPLLLVLVSILVALLFRSVVAVGLTLGVMILTIGATMGLAGWSGLSFDVMTSAVPTILVAISIADCIHLLSSYVLFQKEGLKGAEAVFASLKKNIRPTFLTSLSTSIGFLSIAASDILPIRYLGWLAGVGTIFAWVLSLSLTALVLPRLGFKGRASRKSSQPTGHSEDFFKSYIDRLVKHRRGILVLSGLLCFGSIGIALQNEVDADVLNYFSEDVPIYQASQFFTRELGGARGFEMVVDSGSEGGVKNPELLKKVDEFSRWVEGQPSVTKVMSLIDILKDTNQALMGGRSSEYRLPSTRESVAQQLFVYTMGLPVGTDLTYWTNLTEQKMRINVRWTLRKTSDMIKVVDSVESKAKEMGLNMEVTGKVKLMLGLNHYIVGTFFKSMAIAILLISLLMVWILGSWKLGLVAMIPNIIPPLFGGAIMTFLSKPIDTGTVVVMSVCLGVAVDDTIHFLSNYSRELKNGVPPLEALGQVLRHTGQALVLTTLILVVGFGSFVLGHFVPSINFGIVTSIVLFLALVADLLILPALLVMGQRLA